MPDDSPDEGRFLVEVGMQNLPFPIRAIARSDPQGQPTIANVSLMARIKRSFEARWIDTFIQVLHGERESIGVHRLRDHLPVFMDALRATSVSVEYAYPFFVAKSTPVSREECLVQYRCICAAKSLVAESQPRVALRMEIPCISTYPVSDAAQPGGLFGQLSVMDIEVVAHEDVFPEDLVELVDRHALAPVYSFLTPDDQVALIDRIHREKRTSVMIVDAIKSELARRRAISWYAVRSANFGMLHSYSTIIQTEKSAWVPFSSYDDGDT
jgi:GTP cyclohydrolase I